MTITSREEVTSLTTETKTLTTEVAETMTEEEETTQAEGVGIEERVVVIGDQMSEDMISISQVVLIGRSIKGVAVGTGITGGSILISMRIRVTPGEITVITPTTSMLLLLHSNIYYYHRNSDSATFYSATNNQ
jgi:hypothetical protein